MKYDKKLIPKTKNKVVNKVFKEAVDAIEPILEGKRVENEGPFEENIELVSYQFAKLADKETDAFSTPKIVEERLISIFRNVLEEENSDKIVESLILGTYGYLLGIYDNEDFRYLYRYTLREGVKPEKYNQWLKLAVCLIAAARNDKPRDVLDEIREWIRYLGAPLFQPSDFVKDCEKFGIDISGVLNEEDMRTVNSLCARPEYLKEAIQDRPFMEIYQATQQWAPDALLKEIYKISEKRVYSNLQDEIDEELNVEKAIGISKRLFKEKGFQIDPETEIPVKLQKLSNPPPPEAIDPTIFELIPQKLRMNLMTSVAYSTQIKEVEIVFLGGPRIGRSGILIKTATGGILLDYGLSVANQTIPEWIPEMETIDTVLVSHSHLDHVGGLPILFDSFDGKWCSTATTGAITKVLHTDALKVGTPLPPRKYDKWDRISRFNQTNVDKVTKNHVRLEIGVTNEVAPGILVTPVEACHIPGSVAFLVDVEGFKILYTGDFNIDQSVLFQGADLPTNSDVVIFDGTYWGREDFDRGKVSEQLMNIIKNKGPVIIPSFAVGRSQEILTILDKLGVTNTHDVIVAGMAEKVTKLVGITGKWQGLKKNKTELDKDDVLVAGGGMMGGGLAKYHFQQHRDNKDAAVVLCGYLAPRTTGWNLLHGHEPHECHLEYARLSAHSSASNLEKYIDSCTGKKIMVHTPTKEKPSKLTIPGLTQRLRFKV